MRVVTQYFVAAGKPYYILANSGVEYLDITDGKRYRQTTIPYGQNWVEIQKEQVYTPSSSKGTVTSVGLSVPVVINPALGVSGSPVTTNGTLQLSFLGNSTQYVKGDGSLGVFTGGFTVSGRQGDINVVTSGSNYEVQNAIVPFLLMGC